MTSHSKSLQQSNPLILQSTGGAAAAINTGENAPFNVTGINPALAGSQSASLAVTGVKKVWGAAPVEDVKTPETSHANPVSTHVNSHYGGQSNLNQGSSSTPSTAAKASKVVPKESKADRKKSKANAALFGGISAANQDSSDSDDSDDSPAK